MTRQGRYIARGRIWNVACGVALPCATMIELGRFIKVAQAIVALALVLGAEASAEAA